MSQLTPYQCERNDIYWFHSAKLSQNRWRSVSCDTDVFHSKSILQMQEPPSTIKNKAKQTTICVTTIFVYTKIIFVLGDKSVVLFSVFKLLENQYFSCGGVTISIFVWVSTLLSGVSDFVEYLILFSFFSACSRVTQWGRVLRRVQSYSRCCYRHSRVDALQPTLRISSSSCFVKIDCPRIDQWGFPFSYLSLTRKHYQRGRSFTQVTVITSHIRCLCGQPPKKPYATQINIYIQETKSR